MRQLGAAAVVMFVCSWPALAAEKLPPLDAAFLEYLASFGGDEEDWALFADDEERAAEPPAKDPDVKRDASKSKTEAAAKPAEKR